MMHEAVLSAVLELGIAALLFIRGRNYRDEASAFREEACPAKNAGLYVRLINSGRSDARGRVREQLPWALESRPR